MAMPSSTRGCPPILLLYIITTAMEVVTVQSVSSDFVFLTALTASNVSNFQTSNFANGVISTLSASGIPTDSVQNVTVTPIVKNGLGVVQLNVSLCLCFFIDPEPQY